MSYILHIDTSSEKAIIALSQNGKLLCSRINEEARNHASTINLLIDEVTKAANVKLIDIDAYSVVGGPGSYTGLRIGLSTAKAFCYVFDKPLILENKLDILTLQKIESDDDRHDHYITTLPARDNEYFMCLYNNEGKAEIAAKHVYEQDLVDIIHDLKGNILIVSAIDKMVSLVAEKNTHFAASEEIDIAFWCKYSMKLFDCNGFVSLSQSEPFYLKQVYTQKKL